MPVAEFSTHITGLVGAAYERASAAAIPGVVPARWAIPLGYPLGVPVYVPAGFATALSRATLNALCLSAYVTGSVPNAGRVGQVAGCKMAMDHMAARERALNARHATPARLRAWAAARQAGHGDGVNGVFGAFTLMVTDTYSAASAVPNGQG